MKHVLFGLAALALVAGCAGDTTGDASIEAANAAAFRAGGPSSITIFTMINNRTGAGGHTAMMVNGSERVIFDPAGSFRDPRITERQDVLYGITDGWILSYKSAHARNSHHVVTQEITVSPEQAERALRLVKSNGSVPGAYCANATTAILAKVGGFDSIQSTFYPERLMSQIALLPQVKTDRYYENDDGDVIDAVQASLLSE